MKLSEQERAEHRASFALMTIPEKLEYIFAYYKFPLVLAAIALIALGSVVYKKVTHKDALLYVACANVSMGQTLDEALNEGFVRASGLTTRRNEVYLYRGLYLSQDASTENHEYAYASNLKVLAAITNRQMDVALMNREAYDLLSASGYLLPLDEMLANDAALKQRLADKLTQNSVIIEDNAIEYHLSEADAYHATTETVTNGIRISDFPLFEQAGFSGEVYLGVIGNTARLDAVTKYIDYLTTVIDN